MGGVTGCWGYRWGGIRGGSGIGATFGVGRGGTWGVVRVGGFEVE